MSGSGFGADRFGWTDDALRLVFRLRGWTEAAIERLELEWHDGEVRPVGFPVVDAAGLRVGTLRYDPTGHADPKMLAEAGSSRELFPPPETIGDDVAVLLLTEGESDRAAALSHGFTAVGVPGTNGWKASDAGRFSGRRWIVYVIFDCDEVGRTAAQAVAASLAAAGVDARLVDLDYRRDDGYDLTDFLLEHGAGELHFRLELAEPFTPPSSERLLLPYHELRARHESEDSIDWIWNQLVAPGYLTRLDGRPKVAGKSTLLFALCAAIRNGQPFLGFETRAATVAYCSEQRWPALHHKLILPFGAPPYMHLYHDEPLDLTQLVPRLLDETEQLGVELVIVDTVSKWMHLSAGGRFDPDVMALQMGLLEQLSQQVAVVVVDQTRKGESARGEGTLGSTEQTARADILVELKRPDSAFANVRRLEITGRSDAPETVDYRLTAEGGLERVDLDELVAAGDRTLILAKLLEVEQNGEAGLSGSELATVLEKRKAAILAELNMLADEGLVYTLGRGRSQVWALDHSRNSEPITGSREPIQEALPEPISEDDERPF